MRERGGGGDGGEEESKRGTINKIKNYKGSWK